VTEWKLVGICLLGSLALLMCLGDLSLFLTPPSLLINCYTVTLPIVISYCVYGSLDTAALSLLSLHIRNSHWTLDTGRALDW